MILVSGFGLSLAINDFDKFEVIGYFNRSGDRSNPLWQQICSDIDKSYKWGAVKSGSYRHVGSDIEEKYNPRDGRHLEINQDFYVEILTDLNFDTKRFQQTNLKLDVSEVGKCRAHLGALQWLAIQTQPLLCARCNLLLSDLSKEPIMQTAHELQDLINEVRRSATRLVFKKIPSVSHWQQMVVITLGDQSPNNRPGGYSTGGLVSFLGGPEHRDGFPGPLTLISWKTWKLKRVAISSNDGASRG